MRPTPIATSSLPSDDSYKPLERARVFLNNRPRPGSGVPSPLQVKNISQKLAWRRVEMAKEKLHGETENTNPHFRYTPDADQTLIMAPGFIIGESTQVEATVIYKPVCEITQTQVDEPPLRTAC